MNRNAVVYRTAGSASLAAMAAMLAGSAPALARTEIAPYLEVNQVVDAYFTGPDDVVTYTSVGAGVDATFDGNRLQGQASYRYERRIPWGNDHLKTEDMHTGIARLGYAVSDVLTLEAGAVATRARQDFRGDTLGFDVGDRNNVSQVYSVYAGPTFHSKVGDFDIGASYRIGYVKVEDRGDVTLPGGQVPFDSYDSSVAHNVQAQIGQAPGDFLPFGWTVSGGYEREDTNQLDQRYEAAYGRLDLVYPLTPTFAVTAGVGYENIDISQRAPLIDAAGNIVTDGNGRYVADPAQGRLLAYSTDGLIYDGGIVWKPSDRTQLSAKVGKRYGGTFYEGDLHYQMSQAWGMHASVFSGIQSFGRGLNRQLSGLPTRFQTDRNPFTNDFSGCVFGTKAGQGGCLGNALQSMPTQQYRIRGASLFVNGGRGPWSGGFGATYQQQRYLAPASISPLSLNGVKDEMVTLNSYVSRKLDERSAIAAAVNAYFLNPGYPGSPDVHSFNGTVSYNRAITRRLSANAALGYTTTKAQGTQSERTGAALLGMRYTF